MRTSASRSDASKRYHPIVHKLHRRRFLALPFERALLRAAPCLFRRQFFVADETQRAIVVQIALAAAFDDRAVMVRFPATAEFDRVGVRTAAAALHVGPAFGAHRGHDHRVNGHQQRVQQIFLQIRQREIHLRGVYSALRANSAVALKKSVAHERTVRRDQVSAQTRVGTPAPVSGTRPLAEPAQVVTVLVFPLWRQVCPAHKTHAAIFAQKPLLSKLLVGAAILHFEFCAPARRISFVCAVDTRSKNSIVCAIHYFYSRSRDSWKRTRRTHCLKTSMARRC